MFEIKGKYNTARVYAEIVEETAMSQIYNIVSHPIFENESIAIMPDCHAGSGCVIGFTATNNSDKIIPNLIGVDIGCGMLTVNLGNIDIDLEKLDNYIRNNIPHDSSVNNNDKLCPQWMKDKIDIVCKNIGEDRNQYHYSSIGSLGGGNHFIEVSIDKSDNKYLIIHSGSRNFGHRIATYYQKVAENKCIIKDIPKELRYLEGKDSENYLNGMKVAQIFASLNRNTIAKKIVEYLDISEKFCDIFFETIHNYIDEYNIIRKGAISARQGETVLIPINMRDGSILATGKGNLHYNYSAPHGAGRLMSRGQAKKELSMDEFKNTMDGIYSSSVKESTLDEAPMAYKTIDDIINNIGETVDIIDVLKPIYNFKA